MNKKSYEKRCKKLFDKAQKYGLTLNFNTENFDYKRLNCLWYGGEIATIVVSDVLNIELNAYGDVIARLFDKHDNELVYLKDKNNNGRFFDEMSSRIKNDRQLQAVLDNGCLQLSANNWIEYDGVICTEKSDDTWEFVDLGMIYDNILDNNILTAIESVLDDYKQIVDEIESVVKCDSTFDEVD